MKYLSLVCVFLYGFSLINAAPSCSSEEFNKCEEGVARKGLKAGYPKTEEEMDKFCSVAPPMLECLLEFTERCPNSKFGKVEGEFVNVEVMKLQKDALKTLCTKGTSMRTKFIANIECFSNGINETLKCLELVRPDFLFEKFNGCQFGFAVYGCTLQSVSNICGADATDVFRFLSKPTLAYTRTQYCQDKQAKVENITPLFFF